MSFLKTMKSFLKIGAIGFGGGSALIPVFEKETVINNPLVEEEKFTEYVIVANITPGALPVKLAEGIGQRKHKVAGGVAGAFSTTLPGAFLCVLLLSLISIFNESVLKQIEFLSVGISAFIIFLILMYIQKVLKDCKKQQFFKEGILITLFSFFVTFGKEIRLVLADLFSLTLFKPFFDIQTVDLLFLAFFIIFFTGGNFKRLRTLFAAVLSLLFLVSAGKNGIALLADNKGLLYLLMTALMLGFFIFDLKKENTKAHIKIKLKTPLKVTAVFLAIIAVLWGIIVLTMPNSTDHTALEFTVKGMTSTATSFGGGEAYLSVAEGFFVESGFVSSSVFYNQIVPIANALPGPILVKMLAGIGYMFGFGAAGQSMTAGYLYALLGLSIGVGVSSSIFSLIYAVYKAFNKLRIFDILKKFILPVICGLLLSTVLSMLHEMFKTTASKHLGGGISLAVFAALLALNYFLHKKCRLNDLLLILISGGITLLLLNVV